MKYVAKQWLGYGAITLFLLLLLLGLSQLELPDDLKVQLFFGVIIIGIVAVFIVSRRGGNLKEHNLEQYSLVWQDAEQGKKTENFQLYNEGVRIRNWFLRWGELKKISVPKLFSLSKDVENTLASTRRLQQPGERWAQASSYTTFRFFTKEEKVYLVNVLDTTGFQQALKQLKQEQLLEKARV